MSWPIVPSFIHRQVVCKWCHFEGLGASNYYKVVLKIKTWGGHSDSSYDKFSPSSKHMAIGHVQYLSIGIYFVGGLQTIKFDLHQE
jgi:hypothetical protein